MRVKEDLKNFLIVYGISAYQQTHLKKKCFLIKLGQSEPAPTSAPTWMDGALIGFSFLSLCHPRFTFFLCPSSALFLSPDLSFSLQLYFLPAPFPVFFFPLISVFFYWNFIFSPPHTRFLLLLKHFPPTTPTVLHQPTRF